MAIIVFAAFSCNGQKSENNTNSDCNKKQKSDSISVTKNYKIKPELEIPTNLYSRINHDNIVFKRRTDIDTLIHDTLISAKNKFFKIFSKDLINNTSIELSYISDSALKSIINKSHCKEPSNFIKYYSELIDSIAANKIDLDSSSFLLHIGDTSYFAFKYKNGEKDTIRWNPKEWGAYGFKGYFRDIGYFWIQQIDHGEADYFINSVDGSITEFLPHFSINKSNYFDIKSYDGYGDAFYIRFILGNQLQKPTIHIIYEFAPFIVSNEHYSNFGFDNIHWVNDNELIFRFYHKITKEYENSDTLYYNSIGVKINYAP